MSPPTLAEVYDPAVLPWHDLCPPCTAAFKRWQCAPNPGAWTNPRVQDNPYLLGFLGACRATGPDPEQWRETISWQLLHIRKLCTAGKHCEPAK